MLAAGEPAEPPDVLHEREVAHEPEADLLEDPDEEVGVRPAVERDGERIGPHHAEELGVGGDEPARVVVPDDRLPLAVPPSLIVHEIRRVGEHEVDRFGRQRREDPDAVAVVDDDPVLVVAGHDVGRLTHVSSRS